MTTTALIPTARDVDRLELDRHITEMYEAVAAGHTDDLHFPTGRQLAESLGYSPALLDRIPAGASASFAGVGHPLGLARLAPGERVLDLGSGSGTDVFAAGELVGPDGRAVGVDITSSQLNRAAAMRTDDHDHVYFFRARIEELPFPADSFDVVISNGVINLSADKPRVFAEAARVLRPGGRLAFSDVVTESRIAPRTVSQPDLWAACIAGAVHVDDYLDHIADAGLVLAGAESNPAYRFSSDRARAAASTYGAQSFSLLARNPHNQEDDR